MNATTHNHDGHKETTMAPKKNAANRCETVAELKVLEKKARAKNSRDITAAHEAKGDADEFTPEQLEALKASSKILKRTKRQIIRRLKALGEGWRVADWTIYYNAPEQHFDANYDAEKALRAEFGPVVIYDAEAGQGFAYTTQRFANLAAAFLAARGCSVSFEKTDVNRIGIAINWAGC
jgi:hypothetical protein